MYTPTSRSRDEDSCGPAYTVVGATNVNGGAGGGHNPEGVLDCTGDCAQGMGDQGERGVSTGDGRNQGCCEFITGIGGGMGDMGNTCCTG